MKNLILFLALLLFVAVACEKDELITPVVEKPEVKVPEILTLKVAPATPSVGETITVEFEAVNAVSNINNIGAPTTTKWSYSMVLGGKMSVSVTALNELGIKSSKELEIIPRVLTAVDTICSRPLILDPIAYLSIDNGATWFEEKLPKPFAGSKYIAKKDGNLDVYMDQKYFGTGKWSVDLEKRLINFSIPNNNKFVLTDKSLIIFHPNVAIDAKTGKEFPILCKKIFNFE